MKPNLMRAAMLAAALLVAPRALAYSSYFSSCSPCHATSSTCAGCHAHGATNSGGTVNLATTINGTSFSPGDPITLTLSGGYRNGWIGVAVFDGTGSPLAQASASSMPATITVQAPATAGTYSDWAIAWYGNDRERSGVTLNAGWTADAGNPGHGWQKIAVPAFTVVAPQVQEPKIALSPSSLAFGTVNIGAPASQVAQVQNTGTADLVVSSAAPCSGTSAEYSVSPAGGVTVAPGGSAALTVTYAPVDDTTDLGCVAVASNDATNPSATIAVSGTGAAVQPPTVDVDMTRLSLAKRLDISRGGVAELKATVVNAGSLAGTATVAIEGTTLDATGAVVIVYTASQDVTLAPAQTAKVPLGTYTPTVPMTVTWTATVLDGNADQDVMTGTTKVVP